jgi:glycosyltransferase involved in cell wall biosynthesis
MRILIVHNTLNDSRSVNGVLRHYVLMARAWVAAGHPTDFVAARAARTQLTELAPNSVLTSSDNLFDATHRIDRTWAYFPAYAHRILTANGLRLPVRYDVVIASSQLVVETQAARILARRQRARFAVKIHHVLHSQVKRRSFYDRLFLATERYSCRLIHQHADVIFCSVPGVAEDYGRLERQLGLEPREVVLSGYGLDFEEFGLADDGSRPYDVLFLGRMHEQKGVFDLSQYAREVINMLPGARLLAIGEGPHRTRVMQVCRELGLGEAITFTGGVDDRRKNELLRQSKLGISLSYEEGWGLSICEYMAAGLPVVAYRLPVFGQVFPGQLDEVDLGDWRAAAVRTVAMLKDGELRRERGEAGRRFIMRYDYREVARKELSALQGAVQRPRRG